MANSGVVGIRPRMSRRSLSTGVASPAASNRWVGLQEFPAAVADEFLPRGVVVLDATHGDPGLGGDAAQGHALDPPLGDDGPHRLRYLPASHVVIHQFRHGTSIEVLTMHLHCQGNSANVLPWSQKFLQNPRHAPLAGNAVGC